MFDAILSAQEYYISFVHLGEAALFVFLASFVWCRFQWRRHTSSIQFTLQSRALIPFFFILFFSNCYFSRSNIWLLPFFSFRPYFDDVNAVIFMAALSAYDQPCEDDARLNRLQECLVLFNQIANHKLFELTSMILFLNKIDIFQRKLDSGSLVSKYFPEYHGPNDYLSTTVFFQYRFMQQCKDLQKQVYTHFTHATVSATSCVDSAVTFGANNWSGRFYFFCRDISG